MYNHEHNSVMLELLHKKLLENTDFMNEINFFLISMGLAGNLFYYGQGQEVANGVLYLFTYKAYFKYKYGCFLYEE